MLLVDLSIKYSINVQHFGKLSFKMTRCHQIYLSRSRNSCGKLFTMTVPVLQTLKCSKLKVFRFLLNKYQKHPSKVTNITFRSEFVVKPVRFQKSSSKLVIELFIKLVSYILQNRIGYWNNPNSGTLQLVQHMHRPNPLDYEKVRCKLCKDFVF